jgi:H+/gluconate symporter-like permease
VAVIGIAIVGFLFNYFNKESDQASDNTRVAVKIDRRGNYRYESVPDEGNNAMATWLKIILVIIALALLFVPINSMLNRS